MEINKDEIILNTKEFVSELFASNTNGHDYAHTLRVRNIALKIAETENNCNLFIVEMAALLHDADDWKLNNNTQTQNTKNWLLKNNIDNNSIIHICDIIENLSFKGANVNEKTLSLEGKIVQDADRIDAIGAIGIARAFAYGGSKNRPLYNPESKPIFHNSFEEYKKGEGSTINHFYEKLLLLKDRINTTTGKQIAEERHEYMVQFLQQFFEEWDIK